MQQKAPFLLLSASVVLGCFAAPAFARSDVAEELDELLSLDLEELSNIKVSAVSKRVERISEAPGIISVLDADDIRASGAQNLFEVLERMPGVFGSRDTQIGKTSLAIRGDRPDTGNIHTLFLLNGRPVRDAFAAASDIQVWGAFPLGMIERIELIRGPGSVLYGTEAYSGVVNVVTRNIEEQGGEVALTYGSFNTRKAEGHYALQGEDYEILAGFLTHKTDGFEVAGLDVSNNYGSDHWEAADNMFVVNGRYGGFNVNAFTSYHSNDQFSVPSVYPFESSQRKVHFLNIGYEYELSEDWQVDLNGSVTSFEQRYTELSRTEAEDWLGEVTFSGALNEKTNVVFGGTYRFIDGQENISPVFDALTRQIGAYAQFDYKPVDWLKLIAGAQINKADNVPRDISPRYGAVLNFDENWGAKVLYGKAFRSATLNQQSINIPGIIIGDMGLEPEKIETLDVQLFYQSKDYNAALTLFRSKQTDTIAISGINYINGGNIRSHGMTLDGEAHLSGGWSVNGSISYQDNTDSNGVSVFLTPNWVAKAGVTYRGFDGVTVDVFDQYYGSSDTPPGGTFGNHLDAYHLLTANVEVELDEFVPQVPEGINLSLKGFNLLDADIITNNPNNPSIVNASESRAGPSAFVTLSVKF